MIYVLNNNIETLPGIHRSKTLCIWVLVMLKNMGNEMRPSPSVEVYTGRFHAVMQIFRNLSKED